MDLNIFKNIKQDKENNIDVKGFIKELTDFLSNVISSKNQNKTNDINKQERIKEETDKEKSLDENKKEGHLYLVTEDRGNEVYLWDFTDKSKYEFKEIIDSQELLSVAKEGAMLEYKNGKYELYSKHGYDMLEKEENNKK